MNFKIPTIEEIYNIYHLETMFVMKGFYPKSIKNFDKVLNKTNIELLKRFQNVIKRNYDLIDWKIYIKACAQYFKRRFDLKILGSLAGNKIYRSYVLYNSINIEITNPDIKNEIVKSIKFLKYYLIDFELTYKEYFNDIKVLPTFLKHLYSGSISPYFYSCFDINKVQKIFAKVPDDIFYELFNCSRNDYLEENIFKKHNKIYVLSFFREIINIINEKFNEI